MRWIKGILARWWVRVQIGLERRAAVAAAEDILDRHLEYLRLCRRHEWRMAQLRAERRRRL